MKLPATDGPVELLVRNLRLPPNFGLVLPVVRRLGVSEIVDQHCPMKWHEHLTHGQVVEALVLHLLQAGQRRPLYRVQDWARTHHVGYLYGCPCEAFNDDRIGHTLDALVPLPAREEDDPRPSPVPQIEARLVTAALRHYDVPVQVVHWDLTHVTFTGEYEQAQLIAPGYGNGAIHRRQVQVSLHASSEGGVPLLYRPLAGGASQQPLAEEMLLDLQQRLDRTDLIVISDCKGICAEIIQAYRRAKAYFVAPLQLTPAQSASLAAVPLDQFTPLPYETVGTGGQQATYRYHLTKLTIHPQHSSEVLSVSALFMHSSAKQAREAEERQHNIAKALTRLKEIAGHLNRRQYAKAAYARQQLAKAVPAPVESIVRYDLAGDDGELVLHYWTDQDALAHEARSDGRYVLVFHLPPDREPQDAFYLYKRQHVVEWNFRHFKSDLHVHPLWLQSENRIVALLSIFILALTIFSLLGLCTQRCGLQTERHYKMTSRELLERFGPIDMVRLQIPACPPAYQVQVTDQQRYLLQRLALPDPATHIRPPEHNAQITTYHV
jgi:transposase